MKPVPRLQSRGQYADADCEPFEASIVDVAPCAACLIAVYLLMALHFVHWKLAGKTVAPVEPSEMFDTLHLGVVTIGFLFMLGVVVATAIAGRFFCGWGCHILALQDLCAWLLAKLKIPTKPVRSRILAWIPPLAALYLFVWPQVQRLLAGNPLPVLHIVTDPDGWTSLTTDDLMRSFPGPWMTAVTLGVCGFAIVYFLGSRSFCRYACPYGAIFAAAERAAPLRVVAGPGECSQCGLCISSCKSNVRVIEEVRQHGAVVDPSCFRDMDCVSVCPTNALRLGWAEPPVLRKPEKRRPAKKPYDFTRGEDALMGLVFLATLPIVRDLYGAVSFLLALAICSLLAYAGVVGLRLIVRERVVVGRHALKAHGTLTPRGRFAAATVAALAGLVVHSGFIQFQVTAGEMALRRANETSVARARGAVASEHRADLSPLVEANGDLLAAIHYFERASRWGLVRPRSLSLQLAALQLRAGSPIEAHKELNELLIAYPADAESRLLAARAWMADNHPAIARQHLEGIVAAAADAKTAAARRTLAAAYSTLGDMAAGEGRRAEALRCFDEALAANPRDGGALMGRGMLLAALGRFADAADCFRQVLDLDSLSPEAHNNLAATLIHLERRDEALAHYERAAELAPDSFVAKVNAGQLLLEAGRLDDAEQAFQRALALQPEDGAARAGLAAVLRKRSLQKTPKLP